MDDTPGPPSPFHNFSLEEFLSHPNRVMAVAAGILLVMFAVWAFGRYRERRREMMMRRVR